MTIEEFLEARIAENEAIARAALRHPTKYNRETRDHERAGTDDGVWHIDSYTDPDDECTVVGAAMTIYDEGGHTAEQATHIARHDPARVLRQCAALRRVLEFGATLVSASQQVEFENDVLLPVAAIWPEHPDYPAE
ncbi:DUF6221 family protein [Nocardia sp. NPDC059239]|uniref:DUF6221 family protein n=1 Tax=Nocardia sp. NPDC059239 TaxID=3346785 RepID=UPI00368E84AD